MANTRKFLLWILIALTFFYVGFINGLGKLLALGNVKEVADTALTNIGLPLELAYVIGAIEVIGSLGLLISKTRSISSSSLSILMLGIIVYHIIYSITSIPPALVMFTSLIVIFLVNKRLASYKNNIQDLKTLYLF